MKKIAEIEKQFDKFIRPALDNGFDGGNFSQINYRERLAWIIDIKSFYNTEIKQMLNEVGTELFRIKAGFPLSDWGKKARERMNELIEKLERGNRKE